MGAIFCPGCRSTIAAEVAVCPSCALIRPPAGWPVDEQIGRLVVNKYRVDKRLSAGGFGTVFLAMQVHGGIEMGRVILKFLHKEHAQDPNLTKRFLTEVKTARELINTHIVRVFDLGYDDDGTPFMVQEFIEGDGLEVLLEREHRLAPARALRIAIEVAEGMAEAHRKQIIHRDLKPENLRIQDGTGLLKILDFGIARVTTTRGTATNSFVGTPRYMPPEQIKQQALDAGVDIFALGVITFEMLAGEPPIRVEGSELEYIHLNLIQEPRRLSELLADCPTELSDFVHSMMAKDRAQRPRDMDEVAATLGDIARRRGWTEETTARFRLSGAGAVGHAPTIALPTRDRTPSPAATPAREDQDVVELVPVSPRRTGLYVGIAGGTLAVLAVVALIFVLSSRSGTVARPPPAPADAAAVAVPDAAARPPATPPAAPPAPEAGVAAADAGKPAVAVAADAAVAEPEAAAAAQPDAVSAKLEDVTTEEIRAAVEADVPPDAGPAPADVAPVPSDAGPRRDAVGRRDVARPPRDAAAGTGHDAGHAADTGFQFTKIGGRTTGGDPFTKIGGGSDAP